MPADLTLPLSLLYGFLLVLARVGGALVFVPLPGVTGVLAPARVALALGFTMALAPRWPMIGGPAPEMGILLVWIAREAALGLAAGVAVAIVLEVLGLAAQMMSMPAGYGYASTIDPNTQADAGVLLILAQTMGALLFFALGLDREVLRLFAGSLSAVPPGRYEPGLSAARELIALGAELFRFALRLALPVVGLLLMVDISLALVGRVHSQLQLLSLAFPLKMLVALAVLGSVAGLMPRITMELAAHVWAALHRVMGM
ncbi:MAG TPA: flagellar biosynthetic protein FliR [Bryobacteraceae bacterium]|jgi:flagellar biosynthetic protein FliR|nr:flagellar biosynthetic protein FliR [Bryobacteraceae bacterium]